jgi:hypothetical protein
MCAQPQTLANGFVSYQFPLGLDFYNEADMTSQISIFLEFMVSVQDAEDKLTGATALVEIPLKQAGHVTWCESESASTDLLNVANIDIVIGTADSQGQLDTQLTVLQNVMYSDASATTKANSLQSGLISVVLKGADSFFELPRAQNFYLELEDVISLHFLETTRWRFSKVSFLRNLLPLWKSGKCTMRIISASCEFSYFLGAIFDLLGRAGLWGDLAVLLRHLPQLMY